jgi:hypothetical protein
MATPEVAIERAPQGFLTSRDRDEIDVQVATAQKYPRDLTIFELGVRTAIQNPTFAASCTYALPRGGKIIIGPSIRFAECVRANFKHLAIGTRIVAEEEKHVTIEARGIDFQTNNRDQCEVRRRITKHDGTRYDDDGITNTMMAAQAIAKRNLVLSLVSKAIWGPLWEEAQHLTGGRKKSGDPNPKEVELKRKTALAFLNERWKITEEQVLKMLKVEKVTDIGPDEIVALRGLATALQDGEITVDQAIRQSKPIPGMPKPTRGKKASKKAPKDRRKHPPETGSWANQESAPAAEKKRTAAGPTAGAETITNDQYRDLLGWLDEHSMDATHAAQVARERGHKGTLKELEANQLGALYQALEQRAKK